jgi:hypothetical protein
VTTQLIDNGWHLRLFRNGMGEYSAMAFRFDESADKAWQHWQDHELDDEDYETPETIPFAGPERFVGHGFTVEDAVAAVTEKVLHNRLPTNGKSE